MTHPTFGSCATRVGDVQRWVPIVADEPQDSARDLRAVVDPDRTVGSRGLAAPAAVVAGLPEAAAEDVTGATVAAALASHGVLLVRGLVDRDACEVLSRACDDACRARDALFGSAPSDDVEPLVPFDPGRRLPTPLPMLRRVAARCEAVYGVDRPAAMDLLVAALVGSPVVAAVAEHLGEWPALALERLLLRRVPVVLPESCAPESLYPGWHQDGFDWPAPDRAIDLWVAFDRCGAGTGVRGLEVLAQPTARIIDDDGDLALPDDLFGPGTGEDRMVDLVGPVGAHAVAQPAAERHHPTLEAGDALVFDGHLVHRSAGGRHDAGTRSSAEVWLFAPSAFPPELTPLGLRRSRAQA